jgi:putative ABC transport system ATP-binding protein
MIKVRNLEKKFSDGTKALSGVSFDIKKGSFTAIMGPSGSGKSTLLHILGFLDEQSSGEYFFNDTKNTDYPKEEMAKLRNKNLGFVFQMFNLLPKISVIENVMLPLAYSETPKHLWIKKAEDLLETVGLTKRKDFNVTKLSGGEKQRVAIARALINDPQVIFADEPTGNLDSKSGEIVMRILQELNQDKGYTVLLITHETYTAEHAERIIKIKDGKIESDEKVKHRRSAKDNFLK